MRPANSVSKSVSDFSRNHYTYTHERTDTRLCRLTKEFRTLRLLGWALVILGVGLVLGGFGVALMTAASRPASKSSSEIAVEDPRSESTDRQSFAVRPSGPRGTE